MNGTRELAILRVEIRESMKVPLSKKAGDKNLQRESSCGILNDLEVAPNSSYPCFRASHSAFFLRCCFIVTSYRDI